MPLKVYYDQPFSDETIVDPPDLYVGDGTTTTFFLTEKTVYELGSTITFDGVQYYLYSGGFVKNVGGFTLDSAPPLNSQGVAPGQHNILFDNIYDHDNVDGVSNPRVQEVPFYIADISEIHLYSYEALPTATGIEISVVDNISSYGAQTSWVQLSCSTQDVSASALGYLATGITLETPPLSAFGTLMASSAAGASSIQVDTASSFILGDFVIINIGNSSQEIQRIQGYSPPNTLTFYSTLNFDHFIGEGVWACARKFWMKCTVPLNATNGTAASLYDLAARLRYKRKSRL